MKRMETGSNTSSSERNPADLERYAEKRRHFIAEIQAQIKFQYDELAKAYAARPNTPDFATALKKFVEELTIAQFDAMVKSNSITLLTKEWRQVVRGVPVTHERNIRILNLKNLTAEWRAVETAQVQCQEETPGLLGYSGKGGHKKWVADQKTQIVAEIQKTFTAPAATPTTPGETAPATNTPTPATREPSTAKPEAEKTTEKNKIERLQEELQNLKDQLPGARKAFVDMTVFDRKGDERVYRNLQKAVAQKMVELRRAQLEAKDTPEEEVEKTIKEYIRNDVFSAVVVAEYELETKERAASESVRNRIWHGVTASLKFLYDYRNYLVMVAILATVLPSALASLVGVAGAHAVSPLAAVMSKDIAANMLGFLTGSLMWKTSGILKKPSEKLAKLLFKSDEQLDADVERMRGSFDINGDFQTVARAFKKNRGKLGRQESAAEVMKFVAETVLMYTTASVVSHYLAGMGATEHAAAAGGTPEPLGPNQEASFDSQVSELNSPEINGGPYDIPPMSDADKALAVDSGGFGVERPDGTTDYFKVEKGPFWSVGAVNITPVSEPIGNVPIFDTATGQWILSGPLPEVVPPPATPPVEAATVPPPTPEVTPAPEAPVATGTEAPATQTANGMEYSSLSDIPVETGVQDTIPLSVPPEFAAANPTLAPAEAATAWTNVVNGVESHWADMLHSGAQNMWNDVIYLGNPNVSDVYAEFNPYNMLEHGMTPDKVHAWGHMHTFLHDYSAELGLAREVPEGERLLTFFKSRGIA